jgi:hypothetical protein
VTSPVGVVLKDLTAVLRADPGTGDLVLGGFDHIPAGKDWLQERVQDKPLLLVGLDAVPSERPTQGVPENTRRRKTLMITVTSIRRLAAGADLWGTRLEDGDWLDGLLNGYADSVGDPGGSAAQRLAASGVCVVAAPVGDVDYSPGDGADLDAGYISVAGGLTIIVEFGGNG